MSSGKQNLYFIAIILPLPVSEQITNYKQDIAARYKSKAALRVVPHITLKAPMALPAEQHDTLLQWFQSLLITVSPFEQHVDGFGAFHNKRNPVIYVHPVKNPLLILLQKQIIDQLIKSAFRQSLLYSDTQFSPHITIAYRDLSVAAFQEAWREYETKKYGAAFTVNSFHLLQHDGKAWLPASEYTLLSNHHY